MRLVAAKPFKYATRHLVANEEFEAAAQYGRVLLATGLARVAQSQLSADRENLADLRKEATRLGITVDNRWGARRLRAEIAHWASCI